MNEVLFGERRWMLILFFDYLITIVSLMTMSRLQLCTHNYAARVHAFKTEWKEGRNNRLDQLKKSNRSRVTWRTLAAASLRGEATATSSTKLDGMSPFLFLSCWGKKRCLGQQISRQTKTTEQELSLINLRWNSHDACHVMTHIHNKKELPGRHRSVIPG